MLKETLIVLVLLIFLQFSAACTADTTVSATIATTRVSFPTETAMIITPTQLPATSTATSIPTPTASIPTSTTMPLPTPTMASTQTPEPTMTTQPTPLSSLDHVNLPAWVSDPSVNVLLLLTDNNVTLFAPQTGDRFDIPVGGRPSVRWAQNEDGLYIHVGYPAAWDEPSWKVEEIHVSSGEVKRFETPRQRTPERPPIVSPNGRFKARILIDVSDTIYLLDEESGTEIELANQFDTQYPSIGNVKWSPDGQMLVVERSRSIDDPMAYYGRGTVSAFVVYSTDGAELGQSLEIKGNGVEWSPESPYRLLHPLYGINISLCVLDVVAEAYTCEDQLVSWREEQGVETYNYHWSSDNNKIGFAYWNELSGGLCYIDITANEIFCPVTGEKLIEEVLDQFDPRFSFSTLFVTYYFWSPDGSHIALIVDPASPGEHSRAHEAVAVVNNVGEQFQLIIDGWLEHNDYDPWRPIIVVSDRYDACPFCVFY